MNDVIVYHGGTEIIEHPVCNLGRANLDFGRGFYLTDLQEQAILWATIVAGRRKKQALINSYRLNKEAVLREARCKVFKAYDIEWLQFIIANRRGLDEAKNFDYIEGGVANDRVVDTVNLYMAGLMELDTALQRLSQHRPNNQICLLNQEITDRYLIYNGTERL